MTRKKTLAATAAWILAVIPAAPALAAGTAAGTELVTTYSLSYDVEGIAQPPITDQYTRLVDFLVNMSLDVVTPQPVTVAPQQTDVMTTLKVKNLSNGAVSFTPSMWSDDDPENGFPANFYRIFRDTNGNNVYDPGTDEQVGDTGVDGNGDFLKAPLIQPNVTDTWFAFADIPAAAGTLNGQTVNYVVYAQVYVADPADQELFTIMGSGWDSPEDMDYLAADGAGVDDDANDGALSVKLDFLVAAATLSITRINKVISDVVNGTTNPKAIPGALVEYCLAVSNAVGGATASDVEITDVVAPELSIESGSLRLNGSFANGACNDDGGVGGTISGSQVSGTIPSIAGGETRTILYRATVN